MLPFDKYPEFPEQIYVRVIAHLTWADRLRTLVSGTVVVQSVIHAETPVNRVKTLSTVHVAAPGAYPKP